MDRSPAITCPHIAQPSTVGTHIDIAIHRAPGEHHQVTYTEQKGAFFARVKNPRLELKLAATLAKMCTELGATCAIYEEETDDDNPPVVSVERIRGLLAEADEPTARPPWLAVVARSAVELDDAQRLAGTLAERVKVSTDDYVLLPFFACKRQVTSALDPACGSSRQPLGTPRTGPSHLRRPLSQGCDRTRPGSTSLPSPPSRLLR